MILEAIIAWAGGPAITSVVPAGPAPMPIALDLQVVIQLVVVASILGTAKFVSKRFRDLQVALEAVCKELQTLSKQLAILEQWAEDHDKADDKHHAHIDGLIDGIRDRIDVVRTDVARQVRDEVRSQRGGA